MADEKIVSKKESATNAKSDKSKKPGIFRKIGKFFRDTKSEFSKIVWPTFPSVVRNTLVTLALCLILGLLIVLVDAGLSELINLAVSFKS